MKVHSNFYDGDVLEYIGPDNDHYKNKIIRAFYSTRHTSYRIGTGYMTVRYDNYTYDDYDCHTIRADYVVSAQQPYDPTQMGDKEDDI